MNKVVVTKENSETLLYFIIAMFQHENGRRQGTSPKRDLIGGYMDRWINKIPENLIFNELLLKNKDYKVINDYFVYNSNTATNAPDILGIANKNKKVLFTKFVENYWIDVTNMPHVEVKTFRTNQKLVCIRETQLSDMNYYVLVEADLSPDYLISYFEQTFLSDRKNIENLQMDKDIIEKDSENILSLVTNIVNAPDVIGTIQLLRTVKGSDYRKYTTSVEPKENVYYFYNIEETQNFRGSRENIRFLEMFPNVIDNYYGNIWNNLKLISFYVDKPNEIEIIKVNKESLYCFSKTQNIINNIELKEDKIYKIQFQLFDRSSSWKEYIALKNQFLEEFDKTNELIELFDKLMSNEGEK